MRRIKYIFTPLFLIFFVCLPSCAQNKNNSGISLRKKPFKPYASGHEEGNSSVLKYFIGTDGHRSTKPEKSSVDVGVLEGNVSEKNDETSGKEVPEEILKSQTIKQRAIIKIKPLKPYNGSVQTSENSVSGKNNGSVDAEVLGKKPTKPYSSDHAVGGWKKSFTEDIKVSPNHAEMFSGGKEYKLKNDLKVILVEDHKAPVVVFQIWYKVGSRMEHVGNTGLSHLLEHMMFKGTKNMAKGEFSKIVAKNGGNENAFTSRDYTAYYEKFSSDRLPLSFKLESDRMQNMIIDPKEFLLERDVVKEERRSRYEDDPDGALYEAVNSIAFKVHPYRNPTIGWMTDIGQLTREDLEYHYRKYYQPSNATIVVVGDFNKDEAIKQIRTYFESIPAGPPIEEKNILEPPQKGEKRVVVKKDVKLKSLFIAYHVPNYSDKDGYALDVLSQVLFAGKSSRMYQEFVKNKKMAIGIDGGYSSISAAPKRNFAPWCETGII